MNDSAAMPSRYEPPGPAVRWALRLAALAATAMSGVLLWHWISRGGSLPGCSPGSGCDAVLSSRWSAWLGLPVSLPAVVVYACIFAASLHIGPDAPARRQRGAWRLLLLFATAAAAAAAWFVVVQAAVLGQWCRYCTAIHVCGVLIAALVWAYAPVGRRRVLPDEPADPMLLSPLAATGLGAVGALAVAAAVGAAVLAPSDSARVDRHAGGETFDTGPGPDRRLTLLSGSVRLEPHRFPILGSPDAPVVVAELYDYTCPSCRQMHGLLDQARKRYGDRLAILPLPAPLDADCNHLVGETDEMHEAACELATLAAAVWLADPERFEAMHDWLFAGRTPPTADAARDYAAALVGEAALAAALADPWVQGHIQRSIGLYTMTGGSLPQLLTDAAVVRGLPGSAQALFAVLEAETPLQSP